MDRCLLNRVSKNDASLSTNHKEDGNREFRKKHYCDAILNYTRGLEFSPDELALLSNRAFAYMQLRCYHSALLDINHVLNINPEHEKSLYWKVKVLWAQQRYAEALTFVQGIPMEILSKPEFQSLEVKCRKMIEQSNGVYDIEESVKLNSNKLKEMADFTGPVEIGPVAGKSRRGVFATADIQPGQLLICEKAFVYASLKEAKKQRVCMLAAAAGDHPSDPLIIAIHCARLIRDKLFLEPNLRDIFFDLYPGPSNTIPTDAKMETTEIDIELLVDLCFMNMLLAEKESGGLWILPAFMNRCCVDATAFYSTFGDFVVIRAVKPILKGEEVTMFYCNQSNIMSQPQRREFIQHLGFNCKCNLCLMEDSESPKIRKEVEKTLHLIQSQLKSADSVTQVSRIRKLISLRVDFPKTNFALLDPCVTSVCADIEDIGVYTEILKHIYETASCLMNAHYFKIPTHLVQSFGILGDEQNSIKWIKILKSNLIVLYGSIDTVINMDLPVIQILKPLGIDWLADECRFKDPEIMSKIKKELFNK